MALKHITCLSCLLIWIIFTSVVVSGGRKQLKKRVTLLEEAVKRLETPGVRPTAPISISKYRCRESESFDSKVVTDDKECIELCTNTEGCVAGWVDNKEDEKLCWLSSTCWPALGPFENVIVYYTFRPYLIDHMTRQVTFNTQKLDEL